MLTLDIDSQGKNVRLSLLLKGESAPIDVVLQNYVLETENGAAYIRFESVQTSREWINVVLAELIQARRIALPSGLPAGLLKLVL